ncbi:MAG TPA: LamG domain-containing protein [Solimonas sp.]|nr:LamG domain-containing protein [Solimonas sp.]
MNQTILGIASRHGSAALLLLLAGLGLSTSERADAAACCAPPTGMVSWFPGDGTAEDVRGGNDGSLQGGVSFAPGKVGQAFSFDGIDDVVVPAASVTPGTQFTIDAWVNPSTVSGGYTDATLGATTRRTALGGVIDCTDWSLGLYGGQLGALYRTSSPGSCNGATVGVLQSPLAVTPGTWYHVALTSDGSTARFYVNGVEQASGAAASYVPSPQFRIGAAFCCAGDAFAGLVDEVEVHDRALTAAEVQSIYEAGDAGKCSFQLCATPAPGLLAWYRMENDSKDSQGNHDGSSTPAFTGGKIGQGMAAGNAFSVADAPELHPQNLTVHAWVTNAGGGPGGAAAFVLANSGSDQAHGIELDARPDGRVSFYLNGGTTGGGLQTAAGAINDGLFHHLAATYDGAVMRLYVDGVEAAQNAVVTTINYEANAPLVIGSRQNGNATFAWPGTIDEVQLLKRALTAAEIREIYNAGSIGAGNCADCAAQPSGIVAWLKGEGDANDSTGSTNHGSLRGGATATADGIVGQAFSFDGVDDVVVVPDSAAQRPDHISLSTWVLMDDLNGIQSIAQKRNQAGGFGSFDGFHLFANGDHLGFGGFLPAETFVSATSAIQTGQWYHVVATYDRQFMRIYVNGVLEGTLASTTPLDLEPGQPLFIGGNGDPEPNFPYPLHGQIDEFQLYNRALSAADIERLYRAGSRGSCQLLQFIDVGAAEPNTPVLSNVQRSSFLMAPAPISISGHPSASYNIDGGPWTNAPGTVGVNQRVRLRVISATGPSQPRSATLSIGGASATWTVTSDLDRTPEPFDFVDTGNAAPNQTVLSNSVKLAGVAAPVSISVAGQPSAAYNVNGGPFTSAPGMVNVNDKIRLRMVSASGAGQGRSISVSIGTRSDSWSVTTAP